MEKALTVESLQTFLRAGILLTHQIPTSLPNPTKMGIISPEKVSFYLKYQYNLDLAKSDNSALNLGVSPEALAKVDELLSEFYSPASGQTLYYRFDKLDKSDEPAMFLNAIFHYAFQYNSTSKQLIVDIGENNTRQISLQNNIGNLEKKSLFALKVVPFDSLVRNLYRYIVANQTSVDTNQLEIFRPVVGYLKELNIGFTTPSRNIVNRDVAMVQEVVLDSTSLKINSLSDLLRVINIVSYWRQGVSYNSQSAPEKLKLTTHWQKNITSAFTSYVYEVGNHAKIKQELAQHLSEWKKAFMLINKYSNEDSKNTLEQFRRLIFTEHFRSPNSEIESAVASENLKQYDRIFHKYPSLTIRHLVDFTRKAQEAYVPSQDDLAKIPTRILLQVINRLLTLTCNSVSEDDLKLSKFKGALTLIPENAVAPSMGKVFESELRSIAQELAKRSNETTKDLSTADLEQEVPKKQAYELAMNTEGLTNADDAITLPYLSKVFFGDDNLISPMIYWEDPADLDLSVVFYNKDMQEENQLSFTHYETYYAKHSGDITHASKEEPAVERALIDRGKALSQGVRYALVTTTVYYGEVTTKFKTGVATYQSEVEAKDLYSASGIANLGTMQAQGSQTYLMLIDLGLGVEYVIGKPTRATVMLANTADFNSVNQALAKLVLRDSQECLHYQDLFGNAQAHQPETQLKLLNKLNEM